MNKKIIIAAGGTGGHLFPAQEIAQQLIAKGHEVLFISKGLSSNFFFNKKMFNFYEVSSASLSLKSPFKSIYHLFLGVYSSWRILRKEKPNMVIGFGSYYSLPAVLAALFMGISVVLHEQNVIPGKVNKLLSRFVKKVMVSFDHTKQYLRGNISTVAYPQRVFVKTNEYKEYFEKGIPVILIVGGSQGAVSINKSMCNVLKKLSSLGNCVQVMHLIGYKEEISSYESFYNNLGIRALIKPFEKNMAAAFSCADFVVSRAGAGSLFDLCHFEKPALLIPFPYAGAHQEFNASFFVDEVKGGYWVKENAELEIVIFHCIKKLLLINVRRYLIENIRCYKFQAVDIDCMDMLNQLLISI